MGAEDDFPGRRALGHGRGGERTAHAHLPIQPGAEPSLLGRGRDGACGRPKVPAFSVLLIVAALVLTGVLCLPLIKVQYLPQVPGREISVSFSWPGASALVVEQKVTSRLEAALGVLPGCEEVSSVSGDGYGLVNLRFGKMDDMAALRFEMASIIRNLQEDLPQGVSYPELSLSVSGKQESASLVYVVQSDYPARSIAAYAQEHILPEMARLEGVRQLGLSGWNPEEWVVCFEPGKLASAGISVAELEQAVRDYFRQSVMRNERVVNKLILFFGSYFDAPYEGDDLNAFFNQIAKANFSTMRSDLEDFRREVIDAKTKKAVTIQNEVLRSYQEVEIANFLYLSNIDYEYADSAD